MVDCCRVSDGETALADWGFPLHADDLHGERVALLRQTQYPLQRLSDAGRCVSEHGAHRPAVGRGELTNIRRDPDAPA